MRPLALAIALSLIACRSRDASDPKTWIARLDDSDPKVRVQAVQQLRKLKAKQAAPQIALLLKDPLLKEDAALALEDLGGPEQVDALLAAVDTTVGAGSDTAARAANRTNFRIAEALGNIGDPRAGPALLRLARSSDDNVRVAAVEALGNVKAKDAVPELSHIVDDPTAPPLLIKRAVVALGEIGDPSAIPARSHARDPGRARRAGVGFHHQRAGRGRDHVRSRGAGLDRRSRASPRIDEESADRPAQAAPHRGAVGGAVRGAGARQGRAHAGDAGI